MGQTEAKLARVREEAEAERNMKSQGRQDFMMKSIMFSQKGAGLIKVEEDGSIGLAPKMSPHLDTRILFRSTESWVWLLLLSQWAALPVQTQAKGRGRTPNKGHGLHFG